MDRRPPGFDLIITIRLPCKGGDDSDNDAANNGPSKSFSERWLIAREFFSADFFILISRDNAWSQIATEIQRVVSIGFFCCSRGASLSDSQLILTLGGRPRHPVRRELEYANRPCQRSFLIQAGGGPEVP